jgi:dGTPase
MSLKANRVVHMLFNAFKEDIHLLPPQYQEKLQGGEDGEAAEARIIADYIAGMTDRYAIQEYARLFEPAELT